MQEQILQYGEAWQPPDLIFGEATRSSLPKLDCFFTTLGFYLFLFYSFLHETVEVEDVSVTLLNESWTTFGPIRLRIESVEGA